jgi:hypothetical protein
MSYLQVGGFNYRKSIFGYWNLRTEGQTGGTEQFGAQGLIYRVYEQLIG